jgi:hypothetical protein
MVIEIDLLLMTALMESDFGRITILTRRMIFSNKYTTN